MFKSLGRLLAWPLLRLVGLYRLAISPWLGNHCRFEPSCSVYATEVLRLHGAFRGSWLAARRILRCHPWGGSGYDPVPVRDGGDAQFDQRLENQRKIIINHAYGLVSRGNRAAGLQHIYGALQDDPAAATAWPWFLEQMFAWENTDAALVFAQQYLNQLLHYEKNVAAVKLMLRCRLIDESFRPLAEDKTLAVEAARQCHNDELMSFLR